MNERMDKQNYNIDNVIFLLFVKCSFTFWFEHFKGWYWLSIFLAFKINISSGGLHVHSRFIKKKVWQDEESFKCPGIIIWRFWLGVWLLAYFLAFIICHLLLDYLMFMVLHLCMLLDTEEKTYLYILISGDTSYYYHYYYSRVFHINVSKRSFTGVWVTASLLKSPGLFSVVWPISIMQQFGWSLLVLLFPSPPILVPILCWLC